MIGRLKALVAELFPARARTPDEPRSLELTVAVLLVEMARSDHRIDETEQQEIVQQLVTGFELSEDDAHRLLRQAREVAEDSVSLQTFTRRLHTDLEYAEKQRVIEMLWQVALADHRLDKYEDYLLAKLGELLYVSRGDVIRIRNRVMESRDPG